MQPISVIIGKPSKFYHKGKQISVDTAFGLYQKKAKFIGINRFGRVLREEAKDALEEMVTILYEDSEHVQDGVLVKLNALVLKIYQALAKEIDPCPPEKVCPPDRFWDGWELAQDQRDERDRVREAERRKNKRDKPFGIDIDIGMPPQPLWKRTLGY